MKAVVRQICGLNTRTGMSNYTIVVRTNASLQSLEQCTPGGKGHVMFVAWSGISAKDTYCIDCQPDLVILQMDNSFLNLIDMKLKLPLEKNLHVL